MYRILNILSHVIIIGLMGLQQVHGIDGDLGNPYSDNMAETANSPVIYDGTLNYGGINEEMSPVAMLGAGVLLIGVFLGATILVRDKKRKSHV